MQRELRHGAVADGRGPFHGTAMALAGQKSARRIPEIPEGCPLSSELLRALSTLRSADNRHAARRPARFLSANDFPPARINSAADRMALVRARGGRVRGRGVGGSDPLARRGRSPRPGDLRHARRVMVSGLRTCRTRAITHSILGRPSDPSRRVASLRPRCGFGLDGCLGAATRLAIA